MVESKKTKITVLPPDWVKEAGDKAYCNRVWNNPPFPTVRQPIQDTSSSQTPKTPIKKQPQLLNSGSETKRTNN